jgi:hypothetical protein
MEISCYGRSTLQEADSSSKITIPWHREFRFPKRAGMPFLLAEMLEPLVLVSAKPDSLEAIMMPAG